MTQILVLAGSGVFVACVGLLHVVRTDISPCERGVSRYADGRTRPLATVALLSLAGALLLMGRLSAGSSWFIGAGVGLVGAAFTPVGLGPTPRLVGALHVLAGGVFYPCVTVALFRALPSSPLPRMALAALIAFALSAAIPGLRRIAGLTQRVFLVLVLAGIVLIAAAG